MWYIMSLRSGLIGISPTLVLIYTHSHDSSGEAVRAASEMTRARVRARCDGPAEADDTGGVSHGAKEVGWTHWRKLAE
jgi:hypothetical protein